MPPMIPAFPYPHAAPTLNVPAPQSGELGVELQRLNQQAQLIPVEAKLRQAQVQHLGAQTEEMQRQAAEEAAVAAKFGKSVKEYKLILETAQRIPSKKGQIDFLNANLGTHLQHSPNEDAIINHNPDGTYSIWDATTGKARVEGTPIPKQDTSTTPYEDLRSGDPAKVAAAKEWIALNEKDKSATDKALDRERAFKRFREKHKMTDDAKLTADMETQAIKEYNLATEVYRPPQSQFVGIVGGQGIAYTPSRGGAGTANTFDLPTEGMITPKTAPQAIITQNLANQKATLIISKIGELSAKINTGQAVAAKISGQVEKAKAMANLNDDVSEYQALISGFTPLLARTVGHVGVLTELDVQSVRKMFPDPGDSKNVRDRKVNMLKQIMSNVQEITQNYQNPAGETEGKAPAAANVLRKTSKSGKPIVSKDGGATWEYE